MIANYEIAENTLFISKGGTGIDVYRLKSDGMLEFL